MGLGPPILGLYRQLKALGAFDGIDSVSSSARRECGVPTRACSWVCLRHSGGRCRRSSELDIYINNTGTGLASSRHLHEHLGFKYDCVDIDGNFGSLTLDLNFDSVPPDRPRQIRPHHQPWHERAYS